jgi:hypothetical protein
VTDVHEIVGTVESSPQFRKFRTEYPHRYLVHLFCFARGEREDVELGYYDSEQDTINVVTHAQQAVRDAEQVFKEEGVLQQLDLGRVSVGLRAARDLGLGRLNAKHPGQQVAQEICILQQHDGPCWNLTLVTRALGMFVVRIDACTGSVLQEELRSLLELREP